MSQLREFIQEGRDKTARELATVRGDIAISRKRKAKLQSQLAFWEEQLAALPPAEPKPLPSAGRASENAVEPDVNAANRAHHSTPDHVRTGDPGQPDFLNRGKGAAA